MAELRRGSALHVGDLPVAEIGREDVRAFRDHRGGETLRASTLNIKVMSRLVSFFNHCSGRGLGHEAPHEGASGSGPGFRAGTRDARSRSRNYSASSVQHGGASATGTITGTTVADYSWLTGARAEEIAQLRISRGLRIRAPQPLEWRYH